MTKQQAKIITVLSLIIFALSFLVTGRVWFRLDLTGTRAHTISAVSRNLHVYIPDYVTITYYLSPRLRALTPAPREIEDMLHEFAAHSRGRITVNVRDPIRAGHEEAIQRLGFQPRQVQTVDRDQASFITVYSGIVIEYLDRIEVIPWIMSTATLEYDLTSRILTMVTDIDRQIGVLVGDSFRQWGEDFAFLQRTLSDAGYRVRQIFPGSEIPDTLPALFVFGGVEDFDNTALYRIDRYIQLGGRVLFAVNGVFVDTAGTLEARPQRNSGLLDMLASYGVIVRPELVLDRNALTLQYQTRLPSGAVQFRIGRYPFWIGITEQNTNWEHSLMAGFTGLDLFWPSPLELIPVEQIEVIPLFTTTPQGWLMREPIDINPEHSFIFERDLHTTMGPQILGAALMGEMPSFFAGVKPAEYLPDMPPFVNPARIIVIGDTNFATTLIQASNSAHNLGFLLRMADWLTFDDDIIGIRNRQPHIGRLDRITDEQARAAAMGFAQFVNVGLIPVLVIAAGLYLSGKRKKRSLAIELKNEKGGSNGV